VLFKLGALEPNAVTADDPSYQADLYQNANNQFVLEAKKVHLSENVYTQTLILGTIYKIINYFNCFRRCFVINQLNYGLRLGNSFIGFSTMSGRPSFEVNGNIMLLNSYLSEFMLIQMEKFPLLLNLKRKKLKFKIQWNQYGRIWTIYGCR